MAHQFKPSEKTMATQTLLKPRTVESCQEHIPSHVGIGAHRHHVQARTLTTWLAIGAFGVFIFTQEKWSISPKTRAAALGVVFPGAGYIASANIAGAALFVLTWALFPLAFLAWFGAGAIAIPIILWLSSAGGAYLVTGDVVWSNAGICAYTALLMTFFVFNRKAAASRASGARHREARNNLIGESLTRIDATFVAAERTDRELDFATLKHLQHLFDMAFQEINDWSNFTRIDQFQTSALRYQLYEMMYALGMYQGTYVPNAHAYIKKAFEQVIEKALTADVNNFWKWETLLGKFSTDFDPVIKDNIMVTGFFLQGLMLYTANNRDERYCRPGSLKFHVTKDLVYDYDIHSIRAAMIRQWHENPYCLFPCEPNWIYTPCNFQGLTGSYLYDRYFGGKDTELITPVFEDSLYRNFAEPNGSLLPIRSELTGFTLPGLCGALGDLSNVIFARATLPHVSRRFWAIFLGETVIFDKKTGELELVGLVGADKMDTGNYRASEHAIYPYLAQAAGEYGDVLLRDAAIKKSYEAFGQVTTPTGATRLDPKKASATTNSSVLRAELQYGGDWMHLITEGPSKTTLDGPILSSAPYPGVLIAKACSHDSFDLDMVLYPSGDAGTFSLTISRLRPGEKYSALSQTVVADRSGEVTLASFISGRTPIHLVPVKT